MRKKDHRSFTINGACAFILNRSNVDIFPLLYRGATEAPEIYFQAGFSARGSNDSLLEHVIASKTLRDSAFISTSTSQSAAKFFGTLNSDGKKVFVYEINQQNTGINVFEHFAQDLQSGKITDSKATHFISNENEIAVPHKIDPKDIKGVTVYDADPINGQPLGAGNYIRNPNYVASPLPTQIVQGLEKGIKIAGRTGVVIGGIADATSLCYAFYESTNANDYQLFFNEGARVLGGWSGAFTLGGVWGAKGVLWCKPFGLTAQLLGGATAGLLGSIAGYLAGSNIAQHLETFIYHAIKESNFLEKITPVIFSSAHADDLHVSETQDQTLFSSTRGNYFMRNATNPQQQAKFDTQRFINYYTKRLNTATMSSRSVYFENSPQRNFERLAFLYSSSPTTFLTTEEKLRRTSVNFLRSDNPQAAALINHSIAQLGYEFLQEKWNESEFSPVDTYDRIEQLTTAAGIPKENKPIYQQFCLSLLAATRDASLPSDSIVTQIDPAKKSAVLASLKLQAEKETYTLADKVSHHQAFSRSNEKFEKASNPITQNDVYVTAEERQQLDAYLEILHQNEEIAKRQEIQQNTQEYQACAQALTMAGNVFRNKTVQQAGKLASAGVYGYMAYTATTPLGAIAFGAMAALTVLDTILGNDEEPGEDPFKMQVIMMLSQIMENLNHMRREMHERFDHVEDILYESQMLFLKGFDAVFFKLHQQMALTYYLNHGIERLSMQSNFISSDLRLAFETLSKTPVMETVRAIMSQRIPRYLQEKITPTDYMLYASRLVQWLKETSSSPFYNGFHRIEDDGEIAIHPDKIFKALSAHVNPENVLGLLAGLAEQYVGGYINARTLINPACFQLCIEPYLELLLEANSEIERNSKSERAEIDSISDKAKEVMTFLENVQKSALADPASGHNLFSVVIQKYDAVLNKIHTLIKNKLREQEEKFYHENGIDFSPNESLMGLHETFDEAYNRQGDFLEYSKNTPVDMSGSSWDMTSSKDVFTQYRFTKEEGYRLCIAPREDKAEFEGSLKAWELFTEHHTGLIDPQLRALLSDEARKKLPLVLRLQQLGFQRTFSIQQGNQNAACQHSIVRSFSYDLLPKEKNAKAIVLMSGSHNTAPTPDYNNMFRVRADADPIDHAMYIVSYLRHPYPTAVCGWPVTTLEDTTVVDRLLINAIDDINRLIQPYRIHTAEYLEKDIQFSKAVDEMESLALQLFAFMNLLGIDQDKYARDDDGIMMRKEWVFKRLDGVNSGNPRDSIANLQCFLLSTSKSSVDLADIVKLVRDVDLKKNSLYQRMDAIMYQLHTTKTAVVDNIERANKKRATKKAAQISHDLETDSDDERQCETDTQARVTGLGYTYAGLFWKKHPVFPTGMRVFDDAVPENIRSELQKTPPAGRQIETVKINGNRTPVIELKTCKTMTI